MYGIGLAGVWTLSQPRKHWMCESKPMSVIGVAGVTYPTSVCAQSDRPSLTQLTSSGSSYDSSRCWYSCANVPS